MEIPVVPGKQAGKKRSVRLKINIAIVAVFALMIACLMVYSYIDERQNNLDLAITQIKGMNAFYFDSLNTLMIADVMEEREVLREKMLELPGVVDVRVNRSEAIVNKFGPGLPGELPVDELDHRGLSGESIIELGQRDGERIITVIEPYLLTKDTRGTDCLECHRRIESGTVGGTVRISYSLQQADDIALAALWKKFGVISSLCVLALIALSMLMNRVVVRPVSRTVECLRDIASGEGDLTREIKVASNDEMGELAYWFNSFVSKLRSMIGEITQYANELHVATSHMDGIAQKTSGNVQRQQLETSHVATAMSQMASAVQEVSRNATEAAEAARRANHEAGENKAIMTQTTTSITALADEVDKAGSVIERLAQDSDQVGVILDVIRGITEQTNLLALNAAIEAARAGEQGRGFAVVADEVRTLAQRTQESTHEIQQMIEALQGGARNAVEVMSQGKQQASLSVDRVAKAATSLETITDVINDISDMCTHIAAATEQQDKVSSEVNGNVHNISAFASDTAVDAGQLAEENSHLTKMAEGLQGLLKQFRV